MFIVPYIYIKKESIYPIHIFHIFLIQGTLFLQMNWDEIDDFCDENFLDVLVRCFDDEAVMLACSKCVFFV